MEQICDPKADSCVPAGPVLEYACQEGNYGMTGILTGGVPESK